VDYDKLPLAYWRDQAARIEEIRQRIRGRQQVVSPGHALPGDDALAAGTGRRLPLAVMFLDICGFSSRWSWTTQEQDLLLRIFDLFFTEMIRTAENYGGQVEKNTGDGLMAYFEDNAGDPPADGCHRAVSCALTMQYATAFLINPVIRASNAGELHFRIAIDWGYVTIANIGAPRRFRGLVAIGSAANLASKMLSVGTADQIIMGEYAVARLSAARQAACVLHKADTGWIHRATGAPYRFYRYQNVWSEPQ